MPNLQPVSRDKNARFRNVLDGQKQSASLCANTFLIYIVIFLIVAVIAAAEFYHEGTLRPLFLFGILPLLLAIPAISLVQYIPRLRLMLRLEHIQYSNTHEVQIYCKKVSFIDRPGHAKGSRFITWIVLTDERKEKYYYVFPDGSEPWHFKAMFFKGTNPIPPIRQHLEDQKITFFCYRDTNFIQSLNLPKGETV